MARIVKISNRQKVALVSKFSKLSVRKYPISHNRSKLLSTDPYSSTTIGIGSNGDQTANPVHQTTPKINSPSTVEVAARQALRLLDIPLDIRLIIYNLLFTSHGMEIIDMSYAIPAYLSSQILRTNRQIFQEGISVLYGCNRFLIHSLSCKASRCPQHIWSASSRPIRTMELESYTMYGLRGKTLSRCNSRFSRVAYELTSLRTLVLRDISFIRYDQQPPHKRIGWKFPDMSIIRHIAAEMHWLTETYHNTVLKQIIFTVGDQNVGNSFVLFDIEQEFAKYNQSVTSRHVYW